MVLGHEAMETHGLGGMETYSDGQNSYRYWTEKYPAFLRKGRVNKTPSTKQEEEQDRAALATIISPAWATCVFPAHGEAPGRRAEAARLYRRAIKAQPDHVNDAAREDKFQRMIKMFVSLGVEQRLAGLAVCAVGLANGEPPFFDLDVGAGNTTKDEVLDALCGQLSFAEVPTV